jgi:hypothetical protein
VLGFALPSLSAFAQEQKLPQRPNAAFREVTERKDSRGIPKADLDTVVKPAFLQFAKFYADVIAHPAVYKAPQDGRTIIDGTRIYTIDRQPETGIIKDLDRFVLEPTPTAKYNSENLDYIRELGIALDSVLKPLIETHPEPIVRINAMRVLAEACRSGAAAHWPTIASLIANPNTPTEIKHYALQAAHNLLAAYDLNDIKSRRHAAGPKEVAELVAAIQECIFNPAALVTGLPEKVSHATSEQLAVIGFVRRQAVKALGRVRFVTIPDATKKPMYPAYSLVRVCLSDPALLPAPGPAECAEAAIGLCNMAPVVDGNPIRTYNPAGAVEAITDALIKFAAPRAANPLDRSLPWRGYSLMLSDAIKSWRPLFDPSFDPTRPTAYDTATVPGAVSDLYARAQAMIFAPIDKVGLDGKPDLGTPLDIEKMKEFLNGLRQNPNRKPLLFTDVPSTRLDIAPGK